MHCRGTKLQVMRSMIEKISAITLKVESMEASNRFYRDILGMVPLYGGPDEAFSSLRLPNAESPILNLQQGPPTNDWGRLIFHVTDVDSFWRYLKERGFEPEIPRDGAWGERYFHLRDPDGHELSFARPL
jgi:catechol 2,3-dioxygenase-like lactoylglutathione lyase family enzyme